MTPAQRDGAVITDLIGAEQGRSVCAGGFEDKAEMSDDM